MTFGVPGQTPDHVGLTSWGEMSSLDHVQESVVRLPEDNLAREGARNKQFLFVGVPSHGGHLIIMPLEMLKLLHHSDVMDFETHVLRASKKPIPIDGVPSHLVNDLVVRLHGLYISTSPRIP